MDGLGGRLDGLGGGPLANGTGPVGGGEGSRMLAVERGGGGACREKVGVRWALWLALGSGRRRASGRTRAVGVIPGAQEAEPWLRAKAGKERVAETEHVAGVVMRCLLKPPPGCSRATQFDR